MRIRLATIAARVVFAVIVVMLVGSTSGCNDACTTSPSIFCPKDWGGPPPPSDFGCPQGQGHLWECNLDQRFVKSETVPIIWPFKIPFTITTTPGTPGVCGVVLCGVDEASAVNAAALVAGTSSGIQCMSMGSTLAEAAAYKPAVWPYCVGGAGPGCDPCDDGAGGTLQGPGEHCGGIVTCCQGLTCVGAMASTMGQCQGTLQCTQAPPPPVPLTTTRLRFIANAQGFGVGQSGITLSRTYGLTFQTWVLFMLNQTENKMLYPSQARKLANNNGLPAGVIPDYVTARALFGLSPESVCGEVKAVTGNLTSKSNQFQILGLIDVASQSPAGTFTAPPPALVFTTTGNTTLGPDVPATGTQTQYKVAIWQQLVWEAPAFKDDPNPDLFLGDTKCLNPMVYGVPVVSDVASSGKRSKLTAPTVQLTPIPGDPDPPEVD